MSEAVACGPALAAKQLISTFSASFSAPLAPPSAEAPWLPTSTDANSLQQSQLLGSSDLWTPSLPALATRPGRAWEAAHNSPRAPIAVSRMVSLSDGAFRRKRVGAGTDAPPAAPQSLEMAGTGIAVESSDDTAACGGEHLVAFDSFDPSEPAFDMLLEEEGGDAAGVEDTQASEADVDESWLFEELDALGASQSLSQRREHAQPAAAATPHAEGDREDPAAVSSVLIAHVRAAVPAWFSVGDAASAGVQGVLSHLAAPAHPGTASGRSECAWAGKEVIALCRDELGRQLALFMWMHDHLLGAAAADCCAPLLSHADAAATLQTVSRGTSLAASLAALKARFCWIYLQLRTRAAPVLRPVGVQDAASTLYSCQQAVRQWVKSYTAASAGLAHHCSTTFQGLGQAVQVRRSSCGTACLAVCTDVDLRAQMYAQQAQQWSSSALAHGNTLLETAGAVLALEFSRKGVQWRPDTQLMPSFDSFPSLLTDLCTCASAVHMAQERSREAAVDAARLRADAKLAKSAIVGVWSRERAHPALPRHSPPVMPQAAERTWRKRKHASTPRRRVCCSSWPPSAAACRRWATRCLRSWPRCTQT